MFLGIEIAAGAAVVGAIITSPIVEPSETASSTIPSSSIEKKEELKPLTEISLFNGVMSAPAIWGVQVVGADIAQPELARISVNPVNVVVSDSGVKVGAARSIAVPGDPYKPASLKLRLTPAIGLGKDIPWLKRAIDFYNKIVPDEIPDPSDPGRAQDSYHATHVAGIIGALNPSFGVSPYAKILDMNIFKGMNLYQADNLVGGLQNLLNEKEPVAVINMSHGLNDNVGQFEALANLQKAFDTTVVVAACNDGAYLSEMHPLSHLENALVIGSMGISGTRSHFSNHGPRLDLVAPGEMILSRGHGIKWGTEDLQPMSGTSMAAPFVTGAVATLRALLPNANSRQIETILKRTAIDLGETGHDSLTGSGLLNVYKAVKVALRLRTMNLTTPKKLTMAMTVDNLFKFEATSKQARIEAQKLGMASKGYLAEIRRSALLASDASGLFDVGLAYFVQNQNHLGMGLMYASLNRPSASATPQKLDLVSRGFWLMTYDRVQSFEDTNSIFMSLANVDLALKAYENIDPNLVEVLTGDFVEKIAELDYSRLKDFSVLVAQKRPEPLTQGPVVAINKAN